MLLFASRLPYAVGCEVGTRIQLCSAGLKPNLGVFKNKNNRVRRALGTLNYETAKWNSVSEDSGRRRLLR